MSLTATQYYAYSGYSSSNTNVSYLNYLLGSVNNIITDEIGIDNLFALEVWDTTNSDPTKQYKDYLGHNSELVKIEAWQTDITVQLGYYLTPTPTLQTLVYSKDYVFETYKNQNKIVVGIKLIGSGNNLPNYSFNYNYSFNNGYASFGASNDQRKLSPNQFLRITGTKGWTNGFPDDLNDVLYQLVKAKVEYNTMMTKTQGAGIVSSESTLSRSRSTKQTDDTLNNYRKAAFDIVNDPDVQRILNKYKQYTQTNIRIS
jgi:hypothetical protein